MSSFTYIPYSRNNARSKTRTITSAAAYEKSSKMEYSPRARNIIQGFRKPSPIFSIDLVHLFLSFADLHTLASCIRVSRSWYEIAGSFLYRRLDWCYCALECRGVRLQHDYLSTPSTTHRFVRYLVDDSTTENDEYGHADRISPLRRLYEKAVLPLDDLMLLRLTCRAEIKYRSENDSEASDPSSLLSNSNASLDNNDMDCADSSSIDSRWHCVGTHENGPITESTSVSGSSGFGSIDYDASESEQSVPNGVLSNPNTSVNSRQCSPGEPPTLLYESSTEDEDYDEILICQPDDSITSRSSSAQSESDYTESDEERELCRSDPVDIPLSVLQPVFLVLRGEIDELLTTISNLIFSPRTRSLTLVLNEVSHEALKVKNNYFHNDSRTVSTILELPPHVSELTIIFHSFDNISKHSLDVPRLRDYSDRGPPERLDPIDLALNLLPEADRRQITFVNMADACEDINVPNENRAYSTLPGLQRYAEEQNDLVVRAMSKAVAKKQVDEEIENDTMMETLSRMRFLSMFGFIRSKESYGVLHTEILDAWKGQVYNDSWYDEYLYDEHWYDDGDD